MSELKLEAGKTYVFKSDEDKKKYIGADFRNLDRVAKFYNNGFLIKMADCFGIGWSGEACLIATTQLQYFKLKEENKMLKPDDKVTIEMTALTAAKVCFVLGGCTNDSLGIYQDIRTKIPSLSSDLVAAMLKDSDINDWATDSPVTKAALSIFEPEPRPQQDKIDELEATIKQAAEELAKLKSEG